METSFPKKNCLLALLIACCAIFSAAAAQLPPLRVEGRKLMAGDREIRLRGINWGWWNLEDTRYTEENMRNQAEWGANHLRLAIYYRDFSLEDGTPDPDKITAIDEVIQWAEKYNQYVILDLHTYPGKQEHPTEQIWVNPAAQEQLFRFWRGLAERYRTNPVVGAYEIMNEPRVFPLNSGLIAALNARAVKAIREVDPDKVLIVSGDNDSQCPNLGDYVKLDDPQILYTAHFYDGAMGAGWLMNIAEKEASPDAMRGTGDWKRFEIPFVTPESIENYCFLLRSSNNDGDAWFDDIELRDASGKLLQKYTFDRDPEGFHPERSNIGELRYDPAVGHDAPGSLRIGKTFTYQSWSGPQKPIQSRTSYTVSGWIKTENATGDTYLTVAIFAMRLPSVEEMRKTLDIPRQFSLRHNVPVYIGEFSMVGAVGPELQKAELDKRIAIFEEFGFSWAYWNYRETTGPRSMALQAINRATGKEYPINQTLLDCLKSWWALNKKDSLSSTENQPGE